MRILLLSILTVFNYWYSASQQYVIRGKLLSQTTGLPVSNARVYIEGTLIETLSDTEGKFQLPFLKDGLFVLHINALDFLKKQYPIELNSMDIDLGDIYLELNIAQEQTNNLINLADTDLADNIDVTSSPGILQATNDLFLRKAAFDFSQAFFRIRGYDSKNGTVLLNGHKFNKFVDGRPQWNNWGGLNDITRNRELSFGLKASPYGFGDLLGVTNINTRPSILRPASRLTTSISNRNYTTRLMFSHVTTPSEKGLSWAISGSKRWAKSGYIEGTPYNANSLFASCEYNFDEKHSLNLSLLWAVNKRGQASAITEEAFNLKGRKYNPNWGYQGRTIRNSKVRMISEPIVMLNYYYNSERMAFRGGIAHQFGRRSKSRLGYFNASNPDPTYYRYLPSFYINNSLGANFVNAALARVGFRSDSQISWNSLYAANSNGNVVEKAFYMLYEDVVDDSIISMNASGRLLINNSLSLNFGVAFRQLHSNNYARINDLLGAMGHLDKDTFSNTRNDQLGKLIKTKGEKFSYNYDFRAHEVDAFVQLQIARNNWNLFVGGGLTNTSVTREGRYRNDRYPNSSLGPSQTLNFLGSGVKVGGIYRISGRHWISANTLMMQKAPPISNIFVNPREHNSTVPNSSNEVISSAELGYHFRFPDLTGRITSYRTSFKYGTDINFFYADFGVGSDFVQEVVTSIERLHLGIELSLKYQVSSVLSLNFGGTMAKYTYTSDPNTRIYFDTDENQSHPISETGTFDLGRASIKDYRIANGPQEAYSLGVDYRDPKYWWVGVSANYLTENYTSISTVMRTPSFWLDPESADKGSIYSEGEFPFILPQQKMDDIYLLNITAGKSWLKKGKYISVFASINNAFNTLFQSGGFEQNRNANYKQFLQDQLSGTPSFAHKYWFGYGRTFFINLAYSF